MAGIGFRLNKFIEQKSIAGNIIAFTYSVIVSAGPWIITSTTLLLLLNLLHINDIYFGSSMIYAFTFSTIITGGVLMVESRILSDMIYLEKYDEIFNYTLGFMGATGVFCIVVSVIFFSFFKYNIGFMVSSTWLFVAVAMMWVASIAAVSTDSYKLFLSGFLIAGIACLLFAALFGGVGEKENGGFGFFFGSTGYITGYAFGMSVGTIFMLWVTGIYFGFSFKFNFNWISAFKKYSDNLIIGTFYYLAIWSDDIITWMSDQFGRVPFTLDPVTNAHKVEMYGFRFSFIYDTPMFLAYFSTIPTMAMFVLVIETYFYKRYRNYYDGLTHGATLNELEIYKKNMIEEMKNNISLVIKIQFLVTVVLFFSNEFKVTLLDIIYVPTFVSQPIFRVGVIGAMMNAFFLMMMLLLLYFDYRKEVIRLTIFTALINIVLTLVNLYFIPNSFALGFSYTIAFLFGTYYGYYMLVNRLENLTEREFKRQELYIKKGYTLEFEDIKKYVEEK